MSPLPHSPSLCINLTLLPCCIIIINTWRVVCPGTGVGVRVQLHRGLTPQAVC
jgi:hypothetical protein